MFMSGGAIVSWGSNLQDVVILSSTEAECVAISHAIQERLYLRMLQKEMEVDPEEGGTVLLVANQSSIELAKNSVFHKRSKHIAIRFHFIRETAASDRTLLSVTKVIRITALSTCGRV